MPELPYLHSVKGHRRQRRGYGKSAAVLCIVMHSLNIPCVCVCVMKALSLLKNNDPISFSSQIMHHLVLHIASIQLIVNRREKLLMLS